MGLDAARECSIFVPMSSAAPSCDTRQLEMIAAMTECAFALGMTAGEIAKRAGEDTVRFLAASAEFRHCFFAMRMGIRLTLAARTAASTPGATAPAERPETERSEPERPETERLDAAERPDWRERIETEREREGDYELVSLPQFLKSLGIAAANAEARRDELPPHIRDTVLPTLQGLLRQTKAPPDGGPRSAGAAPAVLARPPVPAGRSRLLTSTGAIGVPPPRPTSARRRDSG